MTSVYGVLLLAGALVGSTVWPIAAGLYWKKTNRMAPFWAMLIGSVSGLTFYFAVSSFAAALLGFAVSAVIVVGWTLLRPQEFDWKILARAGMSEDEEQETSASTGGER